MTLIYRAAGGFWRHNLSLGILILVGIYGVWELWRAYTTGGSEIDWLFAVAFSGGSIYGLWQLIADASDRVVTLERDEATGDFVTALWRPFRVERLRGEPARLGNWRFYVKMTSRRAETLFIYADSKDYPRPLQFEMLLKIDREGLRKLAPEAVADFERRIGMPPPA